MNLSSKGLDKMRKINYRGWLLTSGIAALLVTATGWGSSAGEIDQRQEQHLTLMKERLKLTDGQVNEIKAIMETARLERERDRDQIRESREEGKPRDPADREQMRAQAEARQKATDDKIRAILNDEQKKEFDKLNQEIRNRNERRGDRPDRMPGGRKGRMGGNKRR